MIENDVVVEGGDEFDENPDLLKTLEPDSEMKEWLINYVGKKEQPENGEVNIYVVIYGFEPVDNNPDYPMKLTLNPIKFCGVYDLEGNFHLSLFLS